MTFSKETEAFLWELKFNNERSWFQEHKQQYEQHVNSPFKELANNTFGLVNAEFPADALELHISRIYRDARRLYGRGPYKDHLWFSIKNRANGYNGASFFFEINPAGWCYGLGFYCARPDEMEMFRKSIDANPSRFRRLAEKINAMPEFKLEGEAYKRPKGNHDSLIDSWYNRKYVSIISNNNYEGAIFEDGLHILLSDAFAKLMPMYRYLNQFGTTVL